MFRTGFNVHMLKDLFTGHNEIRACCIFQSDDSDKSWLTVKLQRGTEDKIPPYLHNPVHEETPLN